MAKRKAVNRSKLPARRDTQGTAATEPLLEALRSLILQTPERVAQAVNSGLVLLYWRVGDRIRDEVLNSQRAGYGNEIVATLSRELTAEFGRGYSEKALWRMVQFSQVFADHEIVATLSRHLSWSHFVELIPMTIR